HLIRCFLKGRVLMLVNWEWCVY
ncbi:hypothetical protein, partial [uncultured Gammaproteobacteria bacterium]